jgi:hypothetical protein
MFVSSTPPDFALYGHTVKTRREGRRLIHGTIRNKIEFIHDVHRCRLYHEAMRGFSKMLSEFLFAHQACLAFGDNLRVLLDALNDRHPQIGTEGGVSGWLAKKRAACEEAAIHNDPLLQFTAEPDKGHAHSLERFVDQILGIGPEVCGVDAAVLATRVAFAAILSAAEGRPVTLAEIGAVTAHQDDSSGLPDVPVS